MPIFAADSDDLSSPFWDSDPEIAKVKQVLIRLKDTSNERYIQDQLMTLKNMMKFSTPFLMEIIAKKSEQDPESDIWKKFTFPTENSYLAMYHYLHVMKYFSFTNECSDLVLNDAARTNFEPYQGD